MKKFAVAFCAVSVTLGIVAACAVDFQTGEPGVFPCDPTVGNDKNGDGNGDGDCVEDQVCKQNKQGDMVCQKPGGGPDCVDNDDDGFGKPDTDRSSCDPCEKRNACDPDCDDSDPSIHPGQPERCNGVDNNCDGNTGAPIGAEGCNSDDGCPYPLQDDDSTQPPDGTFWSCQTVNGSNQCVREGFNSGTSDCTMLDKKKQLGFCKDMGNGNWDWTEVAQECKP